MFNLFSSAIMEVNLFLQSDESNKKVIESVSAASCIYLAFLWLIANCVEYFTFSKITLLMNLWMQGSLRFLKYEWFICLKYMLINSSADMSFS